MSLLEQSLTLRGAGHDADVSATARDVTSWSLGQGGHDWRLARLGLLRVPTFWYTRALASLPATVAGVNTHASAYHVIVVVVAH